MINKFYDEYECCRDVLTRPLSSCIKEHGGLLLYRHPNIVALLGSSDESESEAS